MPLTELTGRYVGPKGMDIIVATDARTLEASIGYEGHAKRFAIRLARDETGAVRPTSDTQHHSLGFFADPATAAPCLMLGLSAFRKQ